MRNLKTTFLLLLLLVPTSTLKAVDNPNDEEKAVIECIETLFNGMRAGDSSMVSQVFHASSRLQTVSTKTGKTVLRNETIANFLKAIGTPHDIVWDERILSYDVKIDGAMASVWTEYDFYAGEKFSHCGVNAFQLFKDDEKGWLITQIIDTRRVEDCKKE
ncbi:nuclear transport factor 2 family protein [Chondrinema litorale]|uniref:nuclear transport factor 2 family protein n=1 Tax=Chondrinema litorale TaxID=2994555 RepID=UPI0025427FC8|nr:nuclear transport factor 2 family protein [Chondrinema litorale]UZR94984.1 nuclear transport factor 2 family protein [Chondrinema litorale]